MCRHAVRAPLIALAARSHRYLPSMTTELGARRATGTCGFRLMAADDLAEGPSTAAVTVIGEALLLRYTWVHPVDGEQEGVLLVSGKPEDGPVTATLFDTWHQHPGVMALTGERTPDGGARLEATYLEEWGWQVDVALGEVEASMVMRNVVPESRSACCPRATRAPRPAPTTPWWRAGGSEAGPEHSGDVASGGDGQFSPLLGAARRKRGRDG